MKTGPFDRQALRVIRLTLSRNVAFNIANEKTTAGLMAALHWNATVTAVSSSSGNNKLKFDDVRDLVLSEEIQRRESDEASTSSALHTESRGRTSERNSNSGKSKSRREKSRTEKDFTWYNCGKKWASFHSTPCREIMENYANGDFGKVHLADDETLKIVGKGDIRLKLSNQTTWKLDGEGYCNTPNPYPTRIRIRGCEWKITKGSLVIARGKKTGTLYIQRFCANNGIKMETTVPMTPKQNGVAERMNRTLNERSGSMRIHVGLPKFLWSEAINTAAYLINSGPSVPLDGRMPEEVWSKKEINLSHLRVFGCISYVHIDSAERSKLDAKSNKCAFVGYGGDEFDYRATIESSSSNTKAETKEFAEFEEISGNDVQIKPEAVQEEPRTSELRPAENLHLEQLDMKITFLHGDLEEEICMRQPELHRDKQEKSSNMQEIINLKQKSSKQFAMKDLGAAKQILGMRIKRHKVGDLILSQAEYINKVLYIFNIQDAKQPDIAQAVGAVSRYMNNPGKKEHYKVCLYSRRYCSELGFSIQKIVALPQLKQNSCCYGSQQGDGLAPSLLEELGKKQENNVLYCESKCVIHLAKNSSFHSRTKHIQLRYHFIQSLLEDEILKFEKINGAQNPTDILTKTVTTDKLKLCSASVAMLDLPETVALVEDIVVEYVTDLAHKAQDIVSKRGKLSVMIFYISFARGFSESSILIPTSDIYTPKLIVVRSCYRARELKQARKAFEVDEEKLGKNQQKTLRIKQPSQHPAAIAAAMGEATEEKKGSGSGGGGGGRKEGRNLLGAPTFSELPNGRLNSKVICKLTGDTVNKSEEHIWKHINGKRFLNKLEQKEMETVLTDETMAEESEKKPKKEKKKKKKEKAVEEILSEVRDSAENESDPEEPEFWIPPVGDRWDFDDGGDRWGSGLELDENDDEDEPVLASEDVAKECGKDSEELSTRAKRMSIDIGPSSFASRKKKSRKNTS
ncbi:Surfeit locus protein 2, putative isoform 3 [Hibiscus syriacus]|uniref:Surfeit locus protein 2, putative isoform 3 n=1 Tax=Hibiscus syriacus TaxID=106335 RepID=A0A6A2WPZ9_HIBSY|nr:Surfeit locus protein 2, putative isoform 3 [Hibiscus syriacus]